jgi:hypothetical protein
VTPTCQVCSNPRHTLATLCTRCKKIRDRIDTRARRRGSRVDKAARTRALRKAWDPDAEAFRCHYSGVLLDADHRSPWHVTFDHRTPRTESDVVLCAALINDMKSDLTEAEFRKVIAQLSERLAGVRSSIERIVPKYWHRG